MRPNGAASPIVPTFLSLDTDGRVVRIDSYSKIVAPGSRLGFITAHKTLLEKIMNTRESATQCPSGISIATITAVLRAWGGHEGFEDRYIPQLSGEWDAHGCMAIADGYRHIYQACFDAC
jgi:aromatic amino acid aminotransferase I